MFGSNANFGFTAVYGFTADYVTFGYCNFLLLEMRIGPN